MPVEDDYLVDTLCDMGLVGAEDLDGAVTTAENEDVGVIDTLLERQVIKPGDLMRARAMQYGLQVIDLGGVQPTDELLNALPRHISRRFQVVPVGLENGELTVALSDPGDLEAIDGLERMLGVAYFNKVVASKEDIKATLDRFYGGTGEAVERVVQELSQTQIDIEAAEAEEKSKAEAEVEIEDDDDAPLIKLVEKIISDGYNMDCSDIHIEPFETSFRIRYRVDGVCRVGHEIPLRLHAPIISRLKIQSAMNIGEKRVPQDGRMQQIINDKVIDFRVNCLPTNYGESIVMRILDKGGLNLGLDALGFMREDQETFEKCAQMPDGILLVTGPTGSGKTTTLYSCLNLLNTTQKKIITVEDPVEYMLTGINQVQVNNTAGLTFSAALRSMLRQAPNIIMLGEIRDAETGTIAVNASLTGHFVFSTLHTNDAPGAITRMIDLGIKPFLVSSATRAVMAQRLVRRFCPKCIEPHEPHQAELDSLEITGEQAEAANFMRGAGCKACEDTGYKGRMGLFEVYALEDTARRMIIDGAGTGELREHAIANGMHTLRMDGVRKVTNGMTSVKEVLRSTAGDE
jgi:general secretion pathway protein E/type IV pilus assembly protein PilB